MQDIQRKSLSIQLLVCGVLKVWLRICHVPVLCGDWMSQYKYHV